MSKILIIGLGNIGFYHLLSLNKSKKKYEIYLCDSDKNAYKKILKFKIKFNNYFFDINEIKKYEFDLVIFATTADKRFKLLKIFLNFNICKYIIFEKIVFNNNSEINNALKKIKASKIKAWVNCNYQTIPYFIELRDKLKSKKFSMQVFGGKWSMGTSAIHFLDLFAYLSNSKIKSLSFFSHTKKLNKAKRKGYFEFVGYFKAKSYNNNEIKIEKLSNSDLPMLITLKSKDSFIIFEDSKRVVNTISDYTNWKLKSKKIKILFQSHLTATVAEKILSTGTCELPSFENSLYNHKKLILTLNKFFKNTKLVQKGRVRIT